MALEKSGQEVGRPAGGGPSLGSLAPGRAGDGEGGVDRQARVRGRGGGVLRSRGPADHGPSGRHGSPEP